ncbi:TPA: glycosyltransferase [Photobacterium damselae]
MKIGFVIPDLRGGGAEQVIINLANYFSKSHSVFLFVGKMDGTCINKVNTTIPVIELSGSSKGLRNLLPLITTSKKYNLDVVIGTLSMAFIVSIASVFLRKTVCISRIGNTLSSDIENNIWLKKIILRLYFNSLLLSDSIVCQSDYMLQDLLAISWNKQKINAKSVVIKNPIDLKKIEKEIIFRNDFMDKIKLISIGRLDYQKDYYTSIDVVNELKKRGHDISLTILGEGKLYDELKAYSEKLNLSSSILFPGYVNDPKKYLLNSHALLLTSIYEGYSNVIVESLCNGIPVIATDSPGGNGEIIINGFNGYLSEIKNVEDISNNIEKLFSNYNEIKNNIVNSDVRELHSIELIADNYLKLMR